MPDDEIVPCKFCNGTGQETIKVALHQGPGQPVQQMNSFQMTCAICKGTGQMTKARQDAIVTIDPWCTCSPIPPIEVCIIEPHGHSVDVICPVCRGYIQIG